jgi:hypothetical protein
MVEQTGSGFGIFCLKISSELFVLSYNSGRAYLDVLNRCFIFGFRISYVSIRKNNLKITRAEYRA